MATYEGNEALLSEPMTAFMAPSRIDIRSVMPAYDWARQAAREGLTVVGGFSSRLEQDVLSYLLRGRGGIVVVLARRMYARIPEAWQEPLQQGRLLIISTGNEMRQSRQSAQRRNRYIASIAAEVVFPSPPPADSSLRPIYDDLKAQGKPLSLLVQPE